MTDSISVTDPEAKDGSRSLSFQAHGQNFDLNLVPNHNLLAPQVRKTNKLTVSAGSLKKTNKQTNSFHISSAENKQTNIFQAVLLQAVVVKRTVGPDGETTGLEHVGDEGGTCHFLHKVITEQ